MKKLFAGVLVLVLLSLQVASAQTPISSCTDIDSTGDYYLEQDLTGFKEGTDYCIGIFASDVTLDGNGYSLTDGNGYGYGIYVSSVSNVTIKNVTVEDYDYGIYLSSSSNNTITNITASNNQESGVYLESSSNVTVAKSKIRNNNNPGIIVHDSSNITVFENTVTNNKYYGVEIHNVQNLKLQNNQIVDNCGGNAGAYLHSITGGSVTGNNISENTGVGLAIYYSYGLEIKGNTIQGNHEDGVYLYHSSNNLIYNNTIQGNLGVGVYLYSSSSNNLIYNNYFNNTNNVTISGNQPNTWNVTRTEGKNIVGGNYLGGNYWGSPNGGGFSDVCGDSDSDGICDGPFAIDGSNTDHLPLAKMFTVSGFLSYTGNQNGKIYVCALNILGNPPGYCTEASAWEYSLKVANGSYYIAAFMDVNDNAHPDSAEPIGFAIEKKYPENADQIEVNRDISNVNITLYDVDLNISEVEIYPSRPIVGQQITLNATIRNLGGSFAENFNVSVYVDGQLVETKTISLYFNETKYVEFVGTAQYAGTYSIKIAVDPDEAVNESDENNNGYLLSLYVYDYEVINETWKDPFAINIAGMTRFDSLPVDDPSDGINWTRVDLPSDCKSGAGNSTFIMVRKGSENNLLIYLEGGGACLDYSSCGGPTSTVTTLDPEFDSGSRPLKSTYVRGIFDVKNPLNPFRNWTIVFIPYSTGDIHMGNRVVKYYNVSNPTQSKTIYHVGYVNAIVAMRWINSSGNFDKIVVSGSSAGGFGTILHFYRASEIFNKSIIAINDAGPGTQANVTSPFGNQILFDRWGTQQNYPPDSLPYFANTDPLRFLNWALNGSAGGCGNCIYALFEDQWDFVIGPYFQGYSFTDYQARLLSLISSIKANFSDRFCAYLPLSTYHTAFAGGYNYPAGDRFYVLNINGYYVWQWIRDVLSGTCRDAKDLGQRDLQVEILSYPNNAIVNSSYNITVKVSNLGNNSTPDPFFVLLTSDTTVLGYKVYQLPANSSATFNFTWTPTATGQYRLNVTADGLPSPALATLLPFGSVVELLSPASEANNRVSFLVNVTTPPAPATPTPTPRPPIGGGGGGTGGGGYIPGTGVYYIPRVLVKAGESYEIAMPQSFFIETGVLSITVTPREDTTVQLRVERLKELPPGIPRPEGLAVLILSIEPRTGVETSLSGKIKFGVSIEEIRAKGFDPNLVTVILMRWDGSRWTELPTKFLSSDGKYNYYEAETQGFSYFAAVIRPVETPVPTTPALTPAATATPTTPATTAPAKPFIPGFEAIFAVAGLLAAAYLLRRKN